MPSPYWVADELPTVPTIQEAIIRRTNHPALAASPPMNAPIPSHPVAGKRNGVQEPDQVHQLQNGVLGSVISALNCVCSKATDPDPQPHHHQPPRA